MLVPVGDVRRRNLREGRARPTFILPQTSHTLLPDPAPAPHTYCLGKGHLMLLPRPWYTLRTHKCMPYRSHRSSRPPDRARHRECPLLLPHSSQDHFVEIIIVLEYPEDYDQHGKDEQETNCNLLPSFFFELVGKLVWIICHVILVLEDNLQLLLLQNYELDMKLTYLQDYSLLAQMVRGKYCTPQFLFRYFRSLVLFNLFRPLLPNQYNPVRCGLQVPLVDKIIKQQPSRTVQFSRPVSLYGGASP